MRQLHALLNGMLDGVADLAIKGLSLDSRLSRSGDLFMAVTGTQSHGMDYIEHAVSKGAIAVLVDVLDFDALATFSVPVYPIKRLKDKVGIIASRFYGDPSQSLFVVGVTGTNGKTSCCQFVAQGLMAANDEGSDCGVIGTLGNGVFGDLAPSTHTTPNAIVLQSQLFEFKQQDVGQLAMEVSSHGLDQGRVAGVSFDVALFTNLSRDHLDYHEDLAAYAGAKKKLFEMPGLSHAVINRDDDYGQRLMAELSMAVSLVSYGLVDDLLSPSLPLLRDDERWINGCIEQANSHGIVIDINSSWGRGQLKVALMGRFNASNLLATLGVLLVRGIAFDEALQRLSQVSGVSGRMEHFGGEVGKPLVIVDFAHTPDALEQVLIATAEISSGQLWCVFGCGGNRDRGKRPLMGRIAARYAHHVIITDDNPRDEDASQICDEILAGMADPQTLKNDVCVVHDRYQAIAYAIDHAAADDVVLVAGKGHEAYQIVAGERRPFSDPNTVRTLLEAA